MEANFIIPGMYEHYDLNFRLLDLMKNHPEYFYPEAKIGAVYGNFQFCVYDGGRIFGPGGYSHATREEIEYVIHTYNDIFNVPVRVVFTNPMLQEKDYHNRFGKVILEVLNQNSMNEIVVNSPGFEEYLRNNYPNLNFISSTTKCLNTPSKFKEEFDKHKYKMICLDYNLNHNEKLLQSIPQEERNQCEFLVNAICPPGCPNRKEHYRLNGLYSLSYGKPYSTQDCPITVNTLHPKQRNSGNNLTPDDIYNKYIPQGFQYFKLEGRTLGIMENLFNYTYYMVKPEFRDYVFNYIIYEQNYHKTHYRGKCTVIT
jgi:hypothetical protein